MTRRTAAYCAASCAALLALALGGSAVAPVRVAAQARPKPVLAAVRVVPHERASAGAAGQRPGATAPNPVTPARGTGPGGAVRTTGTTNVALTFDDGPWAYSPAVLDLLAQYQIKATFCVIGRQVAAHAAIIRRIVAEGHTLCDHTWTHDLLLGTRSPDRIRAEMQSTLDAIHAVVPNAPVRYFRCPGGGFTPQIVAIAASLGMTSLYWSVDPQDWRRPGVGPIIANVLGHAGPGAIVLLHDGGGDRSQTIAALRTILPSLTRRFHLIALPA